MSASMLEETEVPPAPRLFTCPCCVFSFKDHGIFISHCEKMKARIDEAMKDSRKPVKAQP